MVLPTGATGMKLSDDNNEHPLAGDLGMYFRGTFVANLNTKVVMKVDDVFCEEDMDQSRLCNLNFTGSTSEGHSQTWPGDTVSIELPLAGYRIIEHQVCYFSLATENRTNKKGLDPRRVRLNGEGTAVTHEMALELFFGNNLGNYYFIPSEGGDYDAFWKSQHVGKIINGEPHLKDNFKSMEKTICQRLEHFLGSQSPAIHEPMGHSLATPQSDLRSSLRELSIGGPLLDGLLRRTGALGMDESMSSTAPAVEPRPSQGFLPSSEGVLEWLQDPLSGVRPTSTLM